MFYLKNDYIYSVIGIEQLLLININYFYSYELSLYPTIYIYIHYLPDFFFAKFMYYT